MSFFYILQETITSGYKVEFLFFLSLICIFFGVSIIITKNPILSVLFLIGLFFSISIYLMMLGLYFIGLSYLLVYVGAISILFLFILMLINVRISELLTEGRNSLPLAVIAVLSFNFSFNVALPYSVYVFDIISSYITYVVRILDNTSFVVSELSISKLVFEDTVSGISPLEIANVNSKSWDTLLVETSHITSIGNILYTSLFILLIITSLILLLAMVGTIVITINKKLGTELPKYSEYLGNSGIQNKRSSILFSAINLPLFNDIKNKNIILKKKEKVEITFGLSQNSVTNFAFLGHSGVNFESLDTVAQICEDSNIADKSSEILNSLGKDFTIYDYLNLNNNIELKPASILYSIPRPNYWINEPGLASIMPDKSVELDLLIPILIVLSVGCLAYLFQYTPWIVNLPLQTFVLDNTGTSPAFISSSLYKGQVLIHNAFEVIPSFILASPGLVALPILAVGYSLINTNYKNILGWITLEMEWNSFISRCGLSLPLEYINYGYILALTIIHRQLCLLLSIFSLVVLLFNVIHRVLSDAIEDRLIIILPDGQVLARLLLGAILCLFDLVGFDRQTISIISDLLFRALEHINYTPEVWSNSWFEILDGMENVNFWDFSPDFYAEDYSYYFIQILIILSQHLLNFLH